jgi:hypothetical protein
MRRRWKSAAAGAAAATVWGLLEPIDRRVFGHDYSDVAVLGKAFTRGPAWRPLGFVLHALNGAVFGLVYHEVRERVRVEPRRLALTMALVEHVALFPTGYLVDRYHPARGESGLAALWSAPAFRQATLRHTVFGVVLGRLASR